MVRHGEGRNIPTSPTRSRMASPSPSHREMAGSPFEASRHGEGSSIATSGRMASFSPSYRDGAAKHGEGSNIPTSDCSSHRDVANSSCGVSPTRQDEAGHFRTNEESPNTRCFRNSIVLFFFDFGCLSTRTSPPPVTLFILPNWKLIVENKFIGQLLTRLFFC